MNLSTLTHVRSRVAVDSPRLERWWCSSGQSLLEVALFLPLIFLCAAYAVDFGYFFIVCANLTSSARNAAEYSIQGYQSPGQATLPAAGPTTTNTSVASLVLGDLGGLSQASTLASIQVCSKSVGTSGNATKCSSYGPAVSTSTTTAAQTDPEAPTFLLNRVDVTYTVQPPVPLTFFSVSLLPTLSFQRHVSMRVMD